MSWCHLDSNTFPYELKCVLLVYYTPFDSCTTTHSDAIYDKRHTRTQLERLVWFWDISSHINFESILIHFLNNFFRFKFTDLLFAKCFGVSQQLKSHVSPSLNWCETGLTHTCFFIFHFFWDCICRWYCVVCEHGQLKLINWFICRSQMRQNENGKFSFFPFLRISCNSLAIENSTKNEERKKKLKLPANITSSNFFFFFVRLSNGFLGTQMTNNGFFFVSFSFVCGHTFV